MKLLGITWSHLNSRCIPIFCKMVPTYSHTRSLDIFIWITFYDIPREIHSISSVMVYLSGVQHCGCLITELLVHSIVNAALVWESKICNFKSMMNFDRMSTVQWLKKIRLYKIQHGMIIYHSTISASSSYQRHNLHHHAKILHCEVSYENAYILSCIKLFAIDTNYKWFVKYLGYTCTKHKNVFNLCGKNVFFLIINVKKIVGLHEGCEKNCLSSWGMRKKLFAFA